MWRKDSYLQPCEKQALHEELIAGIMVQKVLDYAAKLEGWKELPTDKWEVIDYDIDDGSGTGYRVWRVGYDANIIIAHIEHDKVMNLFSFTADDGQYDIFTG